MIAVQSTNRAAMDNALGLLITILGAGGGGALVAYLLCKSLGEKWIDSKFSKALEKQKYHQSLELQKLKIQIDALLSGRLKMQEHEFQILPELWNALYEMQMSLGHLVSDFRIEPTLRGLTHEELENFLEQSSLNAYHKQQMRESSDKVACFRSIVYQLDFLRTNTLVRDFDQVLAKGGIFLPPDVKEKCKKISFEANSIMFRRHLGYDPNGTNLEDKCKSNFDSKIVPLFDEVERDIQSRLVSHGQAVDSILSTS
jgi:hypothetical protein